MEALTANNIMITILVLVGILELYNLVSKAGDNHREAKKRDAAPTEALSAELAKHKTWLDNDKLRLEEHDRRLNEIDSRLTSSNAGQKALCKGVMALLEHELHNGNTSDMEDASKRLNDWLVDK